MEIPIQNLYYLLCYAWDHWQEGQTVDVEGVDSPELVDLFAKVLIGGTNHVLRRGLDRGYLDVTEDTSTLRGRVDFGASAKRMLLPQAKAQCTFDELSHDVLPNRILKSTFRLLSGTRGPDRGLKADLIRLYRVFHDVQEVPLSPVVFRRVQLHSNNAYYRFLIKVSEFVRSSVLPSTDGGGHRFQDLRRNEERMWKLYEDFLVNFYKQEQHDFRVSPQFPIRWEVSAATEYGRSLLPRMNVDIHLENAERVLLIDAKFYRDTLQPGQYGQRFQSANLYQMFAYLKNIEQQGDAA